MVKGAGRKTIYTLADIVAKYGAQVAEQYKADSWYLIKDRFGARDTLCSQAEAIAEDLGTCIITGTASCPDTRSLYIALQAVCDDVIEGSIV